MVFKAEPKRSLYAAMFLSAVSMLCIVFFMDINNPNTDPVKMQIARYLTPVQLLITVYYWYRYIQKLGNRLVIDEKKLSWGNTKNIINIDWDEIDTITVCNLNDQPPSLSIKLSNMDSELGWDYEFTIEDKPSYFSSPLTLSADDYAIKHMELTSIFKKMAKQHNFKLEPNIF